jgi:hypothetical protein
LILPVLKTGVEGAFDLAVLRSHLPHDGLVVIERKEMIYLAKSDLAQVGRFLEGIKPQPGAENRGAFRAAHQRTGQHHGNGLGSQVFREPSHLVPAFAGQWQVLPADKTARLG